MVEELQLLLLRIRKYKHRGASYDLAHKYHHDKQIVKDLGKQLLSLLGEKKSRGESSFEFFLVPYENIYLHLADFLHFAGILKSFFIRYRPTFIFCHCAIVVYIEKQENKVVILIGQNTVPPLSCMRVPYLVTLPFSRCLFLSGVIFYKYNVELVFWRSINNTFGKWV